MINIMSYVYHILLFIIIIIIITIFYCVILLSLLFFCAMFVAGVAPVVPDHSRFALVPVSFCCKLGSNASLSLVLPRPLTKLGV